MDRKVYEFVSKQLNDPIVEWRNCKISGEDFAIYQSDIDLLKKISPRLDGKQYDLPLPTLAPKYRDQRRLMWRNDTKIYKAKCKLTGQNIITFYHPDIETKIVDTGEFYKSIDNREVGQDFDFNRPFSEQFLELISKTTKQNVLTTGMMENSKFTHNVGHLNSCYMVFDSWMCEDTLYSVRACNTKNILDIREVDQCESIYESISIDNSNNIFYSQDCQDCSFGAFLYNCVWCHNCICSTNLVNKEYYVFNQQVTKQEYQKIWDELFGWTRKAIDEMNIKYEGLKSKSIRKYANILNSENCVWHNINNCKNTVFCDEVWGIENCRYSYLMVQWETNNCMDISSRWLNMSGCYELNCSWSDDNTNSYNNQFGSYLFYGVNNSQYSSNLPNACDHVFWCTDLQGKKYCILNKQYTKEEYNQLVPGIIEHMKNTGERWEFLKSQCSPFPYNDTVANDYYPVNKLKYPNGEDKIIDPNGKWVVTILEPEKTISKAILDLWWEEKREITWRTKEQEVNVPEWMEAFQALSLPENISDVDDSILNKAIVCSRTGRPFRIVKKELDFYRKYKLPLPIIHPDERYKDRIKKRVFMNLNIRNCDKCGVEVCSVYDKSNTFQVYCEECYQTEIYG